MNIRQATEFVIATREHGGNTRSTHGEKLPTRGYFVSDETPGETYALNEFGTDDVMRFIRSNLFALSQSGVYVGSWVSDGKVYLDVTRHYHNRVSALNAAAKEHQLAIWDIANAEEVAA